MGTEKGIVQQRKKNEVTNKKVFERDFTLQKNPVNPHQWLCGNFNSGYEISSF